MYCKNDWEEFQATSERTKKRIIEIANIIQSIEIQGNYDYYGSDFTEDCTWSLEEYDDDDNILVEEGDNAYSQQVCLRKEFLWSEDLLNDYRIE